MLVLYVDDGLLTSTDPELLNCFLLELRTEFKIETRSPNYILGLKIVHTSNGQLIISQKALVKKILERFNFSECRPVSTPILKTECTGKGKEVVPEEEKTEEEEKKKDGENKNLQFPYREAVGALMYLILGTRPDLAYTVSFISRSLENPSSEDVANGKRAFRYIARTTTLGIVYATDLKTGILECYFDADYGGCSKTGRSTTGVLIKHAGGAISWLSQRQPIVTTSTTESEIDAATEATKEIIWLKRLLKDVSKLNETPTDVGAVRG